MKNGECEASTKRGYVGYVMVNEWLDRNHEMFMEDWCFFDASSWKSWDICDINPENHQFL